MTLRKPPKPRHARTRLVGRLVGLVLLIGAFALVVWVASTNQLASALERSEPLARSPGRLIGVGQEDLYLREFGRGSETVVLIHDDIIVGGGLLTGLAEDLAASGSRVVVPDLVGFGLSSRPTEPGRVFSVAGQTDTLGAVLADLDYDSATVVGFGWGGAVAAELAVTHPELVSSLVLVGTDQLPVAEAGWDFLEGLPFGLGRAVSFTWEGASDLAERRFADYCANDARCTDPAVVAYFRDSVEMRDNSASIRARRATARASVAPGRLGTIAGEVVLISENGDAVDELAGRFAQATVVEAAPDEVDANLLAGLTGS